ncbi:KpsF/GutQ family sugar-phosphate isomerase [uncultured Polaribacter sp.]|uniref:KpsF/GutQ family sugar-phosphate isomerase n=1 Tax=uncultured Polaribacter sp. TaxID=174711 RepID=UPI002607C6AA|nr:KpsF/GutQ family sugar-phosphate isomerase [uncultured Polaribacter sp.]
MDLKKIAKKVFEIEAEQIANLSKLLTEDFEKSINLISSCSGKFIITGMGKSGIVGKKIAATLASTGTPSFFLHPGEAYHGDLGMIEKEDVVLLISNSGETDEVLKLIPFLKSQENITISMTGNLSSTLANNTNCHLNVFVEKEACPLQLAPTSSTTATMVMGDALAVALMKVRKFKDVNFAKFHPGGSLGRRLLQTLENVMKKENLPLVLPSASIKETIQVITNGKFGLVIVVNNNKEIVGVISDGDIRRAMETNQNDFFSLKAKDIMTDSPKTAILSTSLVEAGKKMNNEKISSLIVVDNQNKLRGIAQLFDLGI